MADIALLEDNNNNNDAAGKKKNWNQKKIFNKVAANRE